MLAIKYVTINRQGKQARITGRPGAVQPNEVCIRLDLEIPDAYFNRPHFTVTLEIPEPDEPFSALVEAEAARDAIIEATGLNVTVTVEPPEKEDAK